MNIHYFQRYHQKENVATANTMLLLSRFYQYSSGKFFQFLKTEYFPESFEPEIDFKLQEKSGSKKSIPDATITQESFKIVIETKITDWFYTDQLTRHLSSFSDEKYRVVLALSTELIADEKIKDFQKKLEEHNKENERHPIIFKATTFETLANAIGSMIDDRDIEMQAILDDYKNFLCHDGLIPNYDAWKYLRMQLAGKTIDFNTKENVYYDNAERGFRPHDYLGLYANKSVRAIGKIIARITAVKKSDKEIEYHVEAGELTEERKEIIQRAMDDALERGWDIRYIKHRYFFVDKFYETDFKKNTARAPMGSRIFDLTEWLDSNDKKMLDTKEIADLLRDKQWS